ncbi:unnamed protein product [Parnassius apollo]|uniref:(apollo) hypothetical protein n=1 Tax=Parnassius apollo TaxID=110799 RepID=A0A8S3XL98_PARAO|nr:unnamed protein product [Parnassius apollo]
MRRTATSTCGRTSTNFITRRWWRVRVVVLSEACGPATAAAGGRQARGGRRGRRARGVRVSASSSWRRGDHLVQVCVTDDDVPEDLRNRILRVVADREARQRRAERRRMEVDNDDVADDIGHAALFERDATSLHFDWRRMDSFQGER